MQPALVSTLILTVATLAHLASGRAIGPGETALVLIVAFGAAALWQLIGNAREIGTSPGAADAISSLSHELRTPLTTIIGLSELLASTPEPSRQTTESAVRIRKNGEVLLGLIDDILAVGRLDSTVPVANPIPVSHLLDECQRRFDRSVDSQEIQASFLVDPDCPPLVHVDLGLALAALRCLLDNAVKFAGPGKIEVRATHSKGNRCTILVRDEGPGIAPATRGHLFEMFRQGDEGLNRPHDGAGVGLTLARRAARSMDGDVICVPVEEGACFGLVLATKIATTGKTPAAASTAR